ncbi:MAG: ATP-dependent DNA helicase RecG [Clostridiales bacterium]|jgi:ATP-dependent DNA helicase RecG|nr:ATP-dependent DNA helicase RecG [Clostridiales bacterium]
MDERISALRGVGKARAALLEKLDIHTFSDLLLHFPRDYHDRSKIKNIRDLTPGIVNNIRGVLTTDPQSMFVKGRAVVKVRIIDQTGVLSIVWFNQPYLTHTLKKHHEYLFTGMVQEKQGFSMEMVSPEYELLDKALENGLIIPIYLLPGGFSQKIFRSFIRLALEQVGEFEEILPISVIRKFRLLSRNDAIRGVHMPETPEQFYESRRRLVFDEILCAQLGLFRIKGSIKNRASIKLRTPLEDFVRTLPYGLTDAQRRVLNEIKEDLSGGFAMNRLVQGDVGSGKTVVAMAAAYMVIQNGMQAAIMAPTEVLARQHFDSFEAAFRPLGIKTEILTGSLTQKQRRNALERIKNGEAGMIVGTHALIQEKVEFANISLVMTDEQHRFGVRQRLSLSKKSGQDSKACHVLVMTATPIPRTLALILYGDMDYSVIDELPPGRQPISTYYVMGSYRTRIWEFLRKELAADRQAYVVCAMIDWDDKTELKAVESYAAELSKFLPEFRVSFLHGRLKPDVKQDIMKGFSAGEINLIVSTTVIEVGVNVPNATVMLIEDADRFGLAQLHQLRGRVGRGQHRSYCILISDTRSKSAMSKLKAMQRTSDGFALSELDLKLRGPGDFFGVAQHGLPEFKLANLYKDTDTMKQAQTAAQELFGDESDKLLDFISFKFKNKLTEFVL